MELNDQWSNCDLDRITLLESSATPSRYTALPSRSQSPLTPRVRCDPLARALGSRIVMLEHEPSDGEISAFMQRLASMGYEDLSPDECLEVAEFIIAKTRAHDQRLDLRHLTKAWQDYRQRRKRGVGQCAECCLIQIGAMSSIKNSRPNRRSSGGETGKRFHCRCRAHGDYRGTAPNSTGDRH